jgi:hypothetical protein
MLIIDERSNKTAALDCGRGIELRPEVERVALEVRPASLLGQGRYCHLVSESAGRYFSF